MTPEERRALSPVERQRLYDDFMRKLAEDDKRSRYAKIAAWQKANPEKRREAAQRHKRKTYHTKRVPKMLWEKYGLTTGRWDQMLEAQGGRCANPGCRTDKPGGRGTWHVDHDHNLPKGEGNRGLLCNACNRALGHARDNPRTLWGLIEYLERFNELQQERPEISPGD